MRLEQKSINRIKSMLKQDKEKLSLPLLNMIKSDVFALLHAYFDLHPQDIDLRYFVNEDGFYDLNIGVKCGRIKKINFFNK